LIDFLSQDGNNVVALAAGEGHTEALRVLLRAQQARKESPNKSGYTALHLAASNAHASACHVLLENGFKCDRAASTGVWNQLLGAVNSETALHLATDVGSCDTVKVLLDHGASVDARRSDGKTALHMAAKASQRSPLAHMLLKHKASARTVSRYGWTPLHHAAKVGSIDMCILLLRHGALLDAKNNKGKRAVDVAKENGHAALVSLLQNIGDHKPLPDIPVDMEWMPTAETVNEDNAALGAKGDFLGGSYEMVDK
jgi:ankyrin repeat protein